MRGPARLCEHPLRGSVLTDLAAQVGTAGLAAWRQARRARIWSRTHPREGPCYSGVSPLLRHRPRTLALGDALASDATLRLHAQCHAVVRDGDGAGEDFLRLRTEIVGIGEAGEVGERQCLRA